MKPVNLDIGQLKEKLEKKNLVCFGAGKILHDFLNGYADYDLAAKIELVLDNNEEKWGTQVSVCGRNIDVTSVQNFCKVYQVSEFIILITCMNIWEVYEQLQKIERLENVECCVLLFVKSKTNEMQERNRWYPESLKRYDTPRIPKVIHYCWFGGKEIPEQNRIWMESWKRYCPDYQMIEWNETNYDVTKNRYMYEAYQAGKWGFVPDYARMDIVYHHGGIYLDTDVEIIKSLDELLYQDAFAGVDATHNISLGLGFGARPGFGLFQELMHAYDELSFLNSDGTVNMIASPTLQIPFFKRKGYENTGEYQVISDLTVYPEKILSGKCNFTGRILPTERTFAIHHYDGSWNSGEKRKYIMDGHRLYGIFDV